MNVGVPFGDKNLKHKLRDEEAGDFIHQHMAHWLKTVEPYTKVTGVRPWMKATNVEPLTKVSSGTA